ncbi:MarR family winged helix-turn-helix transcriptional regulator [uncultured Cellulomonas sp.]|uniref:MarR family winged helix-turn-helix transcriptional regulator n=1 Tax=uncultured Cellulomonas sp. TaxID=189682 RepID=UPI002614ED0F|nr:MarR family transcriptional regulator [uncultured Cellulomonas sp.]
MERGAGGYAGGAGGDGLDPAGVDPCPADPSRADLLDRLRADTHAVSTFAARRGMDPVMSLPLTIQQLKLLMVVVTAGPVTTHHVAEDLGLTAATVSGIVDRLVERDLVVRDHDASDRRIRPLRATPAGVAIVDGLTKVTAWHEQEVLSRLATDDLAALVRGFGALRRAVDELAAGGSGPAGGGFGTPGDGPAAR